MCCYNSRRRVGSRLQGSVGEEDTGHSAGVKKRRTKLKHGNPTPAVNITISNPSSFQAVKEGNWMILLDGWCERQFWYSVTEYVSVDIDDSLIPANGIRLRCNQLPFYTEWRGWNALPLVSWDFNMSVSLSPDMLWFGAVNTPQEFVSNPHSVKCPHKKKLCRFGIDNILGQYFCYRIKSKQT